MENVGPDTRLSTLIKDMDHPVNVGATSEKNILFMLMSFIKVSQQLLARNATQFSLYKAGFRLRVKSDSGIAWDLLYDTL